jgi:hypothetical protein
MPSSPANPAEQKQKENASPDALRVPAVGKPHRREGDRLTDLQHKMEEAARAWSQSRGRRSGLPNPGGDSSIRPISFDTTWYDWGPTRTKWSGASSCTGRSRELARLAGREDRPSASSSARDGRVEGAKILSVLRSAAV